VKENYISRYLCPYWGFGIVHSFRNKNSQPNLSLNLNSKIWEKETRKEKKKRKKLENLWWAQTSLTTHLTSLRTAQLQEISADTLGPRVSLTALAHSSSITDNWAPLDRALHSSLSLSRGPNLSARLPPVGAQLHEAWISAMDSGGGCWCPGIDPLAL
jgi:hypothetical protein